MRLDRFQDWGTSQFPGFCAVAVAGDPPGKTHEYLEARVLVPNATVPPADMVTTDAGAVMAPAGGVVKYRVSWMKRAFEGTPALSRRNNM